MVRKALTRGKRDDGYLSLNRSDHAHSSVDEPEEQGEDKSIIIGKIIKVKQDIDSQFNRMAAPEQIPRVIKRQKRNIVETNRTINYEGASRVVMT